MKIGLTGAGGYIGTRVMNDLIEKNHEAVGIDNGYLSQADSVSGVKINKADVQNLDEIEPLLKNCDAIFHLAAISGVPDCESNKNHAYMTNIVGTQNISWICRKYSIPLVFVSSMAVFGNPTKFPIQEDDPKNPINFYGFTKLAGMDIVDTFSRKQFPAYVFILGNVYGNHQVNGKVITKNTVINKFVQQAERGEKLTVYKPGTQSRDFIHVKDVSRIFVSSADMLVNDEKKAKSYNLASSKSYSVLDIAEMVRNERPNIDIEMIENPRKETLVKDFNININKIRKELNLEPSLRIEDAVKEMF